MGWVWHRSVISQRWFAAVVGLALLVQVLVPQGFMLAPDAAGATTLYICSGHSPIGGIDHDKSGKAPNSTGGSVCDYASHGAAAPPPIVISLAAMTLPATALSPKQSSAAQPGLGLAAPPPPSHAPPLA